MITLSQWCNEARQKLSIINKKNSQNEILHLIQFGLNITLQQIILHISETLKQEDIIILDNLLSQRLQGKPISKIIGLKSFAHLDFITSTDVLDPRQETEQLVMKALEIIKHIEKPKILDLCTGSGCIIITILDQLTKQQKQDGVFHASDICKKALQIAHKNLQKYNYTNNIELIHSDLFEKIPNIKYDLIISNPPYLQSEQNVGLEATYDPDIALFASNSGMFFYAQILSKGHTFLDKNGYIMLEAPTKLCDPLIQHSRSYKRHFGINMKVRNVYGHIVQI